MVLRTCKICEEEFNKKDEYLEHLKKEELEYTVAEIDRLEMERESLEEEIRNLE